MMTTPGGTYKNVVENDFLLPRIIGVATFLLGILALSILIALAGWTKSKNMAIFTTIIGVLTFVIVLLMTT